jgi:RNase P subunit RPR2
VEQYFEDLKKIKKNICPKCGSILEVIINLKMDDTTERIPVCKKCNMAFRVPDVYLK